MKLIPLTQGYFAQVSNRDYQEVAKYKWQVQIDSKCDTQYARRTAINPVTGKKQGIYMHRQILGFPASHIDHRDTKGLNNQRRNLRKATHRQNQANRRNKKVLKGASYQPRTGKWRSVIYDGALGKTRHLGTRDTQIEAHKLYLVEAKKMYGKFVRSC